MEIHGPIEPIEKVLVREGFKTRLQTYEIPPHLYSKWLKASPKWYTLGISLYRLLASTTAKPQVAVLKAYRWESR